MKTEPYRLIIPRARLLYARGLYHPLRISLVSGKPTYGCTLAVPREEVHFLRALAVGAAWQQWRDICGFGSSVRVNIFAGDGKEARNRQTKALHPGLGPDVVFIRASSLKQPDVNGPEADIYSGCYGSAVVSAYAWTGNEIGNGVSFALHSFTKTEAGDRLA